MSAIIDFYKLFFATLLALGGTGCWIQLSLVSDICQRRLYINSLRDVVQPDIWAPDNRPLVRFFKKTNNWRFIVANEATLKSPGVLNLPEVLEIRHLPAVVRVALEHLRNNGHLVTFDPNNEALQSWLAGTAGATPELIAGSTSINLNMPGLAEQNIADENAVSVADSGSRTDIDGVPMDVESDRLPPQAASIAHAAPAPTDGVAPRRSSRTSAPSSRRQESEAQGVWPGQIRQPENEASARSKRTKEEHDQFLSDRDDFKRMLACQIDGTQEADEADGVREENQANEAQGQNETANGAQRADFTTKVENHPAFQYILRDFFDFMDSICLMTCIWCNEIWPNQKPDSPSDYRCDRCKRQAARQCSFGTDNNTQPLIFCEQKRFADEFHKRRATRNLAQPLVSVEAEIALDQQLASQLADNPGLNFKVPRCPFDARHDVFTSATDMEKFCISRVRVFAFIFRRGGVYCGMKGTIIAFSDISPKAEILSKLPNIISPYVNIRIQKKDGSFPDKKLPCQRVRRRVIELMLAFLQAYGTDLIMSDVVDINALQSLPEDGYLHDLVDIEVETGANQPSRAEAVSSATDAYQSTGGTSVGRSIRLSAPQGEPRTTNVEPADADGPHESDADEEPLPQAEPANVHQFDEDEDGIHFELEEGDESAHIMDTLSDRLVGSGVATGNTESSSTSRVDVDDEDPSDNNEDSSEEPSSTYETEADGEYPFDNDDDDDDDAAQETEQDLYDNKHDDTLMMHVQEQELSYLESECPNADMLDAACDLFNVSAPNANADSTQDVELLYKKGDQPMRLTHPWFFPLAFPWLFCNMQGVPRYSQTDAALAASYLPQQYPVEPLDQVNHLLRLGFRSALGYYVFPFQSTSLFMIVSRQIVSRQRSIKKCAWIFKNEFPSVTLDDLRQWLMEEGPGGLKRLQGVLKRCISANVGEAAYFFSKLKLAKEIAAQLGNFNVFVTRSFADIHHPVVLRCLGLPLDADYQVRRDVVGNAPGVATAIFQMLVDKIDSSFFGDLLQRQHGCRRFEFQSRSAIHDHSVSQIPAVDYTDAVKAVVLGRASANQLFLMKDQLAESQHEFMKEEPKFNPENPDKIQLSGKTVVELIRNVEAGRAAEKRLIQASELFLCGINPAVDPANAPGVTDQMRTQKCEDYKKACKQEFKDRDIVTDLLSKKPGPESKTPNGRPLVTAEAICLLVNRCMIHQHVDNYCYNTKPRKAAKQCRFGVPRNVRSVSVIDLEFKKGSSVPIVSVLPRLNHPDLVPYCRSFLRLWCQNCDFRVIFDPERIMRYTLKYTLKRDILKPFLKEIAIVLRGQSAATVSPAAGRIANKLKEGLYDNATQMIADLVNTTAAAREVGMPEVFIALSSESMVKFHNVRFIYVPHIYSKRLERDQSADGGGVALRNSIWLMYSNRMQVARQRGQETLASLNPEVLRRMSSAEFFGKFFVNKKGIVRPHVAARGPFVTIWPDWCDLYQVDPESPKFYIWAQWFMLRFVPWEAGENPKQFLKSFIERTNDHLLAIGEPAIAVDPTLNLSDESNIQVQSLILDCYRHLIKLDEKAKWAFETMIKPYHLVERIRREERAEGDTGPIGVNQLPNSTPVDPNEDEMVSTGESFAIPEQSDETVSASLLARSKTDMLPPLLRKLDPATLG